MTKNLRLEDIVRIAGRVGWKGYTVEDLKEEGPWVIGANDISVNHKLSLTKAKHISREKFEESPEIMIERNDILIVKVGSTIGKVAIVNFDIGEACINPNTVLLKKCSQNPQYLYYYLVSDYGQKFLLNNSSASAQSALNQTDLKKLPINFPDKKTQGKIASVLSALDDKIELSNKINAELEALAKTIYDYWFVQFDFPDKNGKTYKSSGGKMVYNEVLKREIPEGWEVKSIFEVSSLLTRGMSPSYTEERGIPVLNQKCIRNKTIDFSFARRHDSDSKPVTTKLIQEGDVLVNSTGVGTLGRLAVVKWMLEKAITVDSHVTIIRLDRNAIDTTYGQFAISEKQTDIEKFGIGSTGQTELSRDELGKVSIIVPDKFSQKLFSDIVWASFSKMAQNEKENIELTSLRDWLLPMLMNGQVTVKDAYEQVEGVLSMAAEDSL